MGLLGKASALCLAAGLACAGQAAAQNAPADARYLEALARMQLDLSDPDATFAFARAAVEAGDLAGAISALERLLAADPALNNIRFELGLLYLRVGQLELSRLYLSEALSARDMPDFVRSRAQAALEEVEGRASRHAVSGDLFLGLRHQTNPNSTPDSLLVFDPFFGSIVIDGAQPGVQNSDDFSLIASGTAEYRYTLGSQAARELVVDGNVYLSEHAHTDNLNVQSAGLRIGPRFYGGGLAPASATRPYLSASTLSLDGDSYFSAIGAGLSHDRRVGNWLTLGAIMHWEKRTFEASATRPNTPDQTGDYYGVGLSAGLQRPGALSWAARLAFDSARTRVDFQDFDRLDLSLAASRRIFAFNLTLNAGYRNSRYGGPDPLVSPTLTRVEDRYAVGLSADFHIFDSTRLNARLEQVWNNATIPNNRFEDTAVLIGVERIF